MQCNAMQFSQAPVHMTPEKPEPGHSLVFTPAFSVTFRDAIFRHNLARVKNVS